MRRFSVGLLVFGDAMCSFNPTNVKFHSIANLVTSLMFSCIVRQAPSPTAKCKSLGRALKTVQIKSVSPAALATPGRASHRCHRLLGPPVFRPSTIAVAGPDRNVSTVLYVTRSGWGYSGRHRPASGPSPAQGGSQRRRTARLPASSPPPPSPQRCAPTALGRTASRGSRR